MYNIQDRTKVCGGPRLDTVMGPSPFLPAGQLAVLKLLRRPILQFFTLQGRHDSRISMKFSMPQCKISRC